MAKANQAKAMDVYGAPPPAVLDSLTEAQKDVLDHYISKVASNVYKIAFDCGKQHMLRETKAALERLAK